MIPRDGEETDKHLEAQERRHMYSIRFRHNHLRLLTDNFI